MKSISLFLCVFVASWQFSLSAQVTFPQVIDGIYVKENVPKVRFEPNAFLVIYSLPQLLDTLRAAQLRTSIAKINSDFPKQPLKINDCVYFDAFLKNKSQLENFSLNYFPTSFLPPSLRFSTDANKNSVDSLFSMQLFPKVQLEKYAQPFYFKKTEVTNAEYREFVSYVRDSVARRILAKNGFEDDYLLSEEQLIRMGNHPDSVENIDKEYWPLNNKTKVYWNETGADYKASLEEIYVPAMERFWHRKEIDKRKLNYVYFTNKNNEVYKHVINIYPDTLCWIHDFNTYSSEAMSNMYCWHPAYDDYPVVGISFDQAKAFLHWKTETEQKKLNAKGEKYIIEYDLPTEIEWEIAASSERKDGKIISYGQHYPAFTDKSWMTDLIVDSSMFVNEKIKVVLDTNVYEVPQMILAPGYNNRNSYIQSDDSTYEKNGKTYRRSIRWYYWSTPRKTFVNNTSRTFWQIDNKLFTSPANLEGMPATKTIKGSEIVNGKNVKKETIVDNSVILTQLDKNGISFMGGNVSEWLNEDYSDWLPAFETRLKMLRSIGTPDAEMEYQREFYFNTFNAKNGKLVRGANWFDERYGNFLDKNPAGMNAKIFVDPSKSHCTIGFRYVVRVKKK